MTQGELSEATEEPHDLPRRLRSEQLQVYLSDLANAPTVPDSEGANAWRLAKHHGQELLHAQGIGWLTYNQRIWSPGDTTARRWAAQISRYIEAEAQQKFHLATKAQTEDERRAFVAEANQLLGHRRQSERTSAIAAALKQAEVLLDVPSSSLDKDSNLFNTLSGTINLVTGKIRPHDPDDLLTCCADVGYDPQATCPTWTAFMESTMPNRALRRYLQKAVGYSLSGSVKEQAIFILYGRGANGKSTFLNVIVNLLGSGYATRAAPELLMASGGLDRHPTEVADLCGVRLAFASEVEVGRSFATGRLKELTGEVLLKARKMRGDFFVFPNTAKIFLALNDLPSIHDTSEGAWRRLKIIPFTQTFARNDRDPDLLDKLLAELPGILNWALEGNRLWRSEGLEEVPEMVTTLSKYRSETDGIGSFVEDTCETGNSTFRAKPGEFYQHYQAWCSYNGRKPLNNTEFKRQLEEKGFTQGKIQGNFYYKGIRLAPVLPLQKAA